MAALITRARPGCVLRSSRATTPRSTSPSSQPTSRSFMASHPGSASASSRSWDRSEEHTSELQSRVDLVCRLLLEKKNMPRNSSSSSNACTRAPISRARASGSRPPSASSSDIFCFNDPATTEIYTLSLHDALPISIVGFNADVPFAACGVQSFETGNWRVGAPIVGDGGHDTYSLFDLSRRYNETFVPVIRGDNQDSVHVQVA